MADFGWAFVKGGLVSGSAPPSGAVQFNDNGNFGGSPDLVFTSGSTSTLEMTGNILVNGEVSASTFYGDGSNLSGITTSPAGATTQIQYNNAGAFAGSANLTFDGSTLNVTGNLNVSGTLAANELIVNVENRNVINISATGSTQFGDSTDDTHIFTGSMEISAASNPLKLYGVQAGTPPNSSSYLALDSSYNLVLTSAAGADSDGGTIGDAEDGTYTDGLFTDFIASTPIGTAIDRFNEILSIIVPGPAPAVDRINYTNTSGIETKLSFDTGASAPSGYVDVESTGSFTSPPSIDDQYTVTTSGEDYRLGVYDGTQEITGAINFNVAEQLKSTEVNYSNDAFGNGQSGSLNLYLNETLLHTLNLDGFAGSGNPNTGSASDLNLNGSGFFDVSVSASARDQNGSEYDIFQHRTAKYVIDPNDQNKGWNYAKVEHVYGSTTYITNFVQWFNDTDASSQALSISNQRTTFTGQGSKYLSGVEYFRSASITYNAEVANAYKFTYPTGNVLTFNRTTNVDTISAQSLPATDGTDLYNKVFEITGSTNTNDDTMLDDSATISINLSHPLKTNLSTAGAVITDEILIYHRDTANSNTIENFELENYRLISDGYSTQGAVSSGTWDSQNHMTSSGATGHTDGLLVYNSRLYSPKQGANSGDFSTLTNGPSGNPDYSSVTGTRTFFRKLENTTGSPVYDLKITSTKNTKINNTTLTTDNVKFFVKIPPTTGWMDISQNFSYGNIGDNDGALINGASDNSNTGTTSTSNSVHCITFGTASIPAGSYAVIKIEADASWTKYFETLQFQLGASDTDDAATPDEVADLNLTDSAGIAAKLSFGGNNSVSGYSKVAGIGSLTAVNVNELFSDDEDVTRGVFSAFEVMGGTINPTASAGASNAFYNAYTGSLILEINGAEETTIDLESTRNAISSITDDTGLSVSSVAESLTSDGIPDYRLHYRTGTYSVGVNDQNSGWNYARVIHRVGGADTTTNYVEWVVDPSGSVDDTNVSTPVLSDFNHTDIYYQSGIGYFAANPTASFSFTGSNFYSNVYQNGTAISFPLPSNCQVTNIRITGSGINTFDSAVSSCNMPSLNETNDCELTSIEVTASVTYNGGTSISGAFFSSQDASISGRVLHPFKSNGTAATQTKTDFMRYSGSIGSTTEATDEYFGLETYRIVSGNYANQAAVTSSANTWNSTLSINDTASYAEHADGMVTANGKVFSPLKIGVAGDTGHANLQAPAGNPDYSSLDISERTYYRYFKNNSGTLQASGLTISIYGNATLIPKTGTLGANNNVMVEIKVPSDPTYTGGNDKSTGWCDVGSPLDDQLDPKVDGFGLYTGDLNTDTAELTIATLNFFSSGIYANQYFVVKITAHENWTGSINRIRMVYA